ncbi:MAG: 4Fe-4S dicluster domain-containing protein [Desulfobacterales bacterium]|nr:4Fe-4S dicluster domain-containing protein [Desulfobacterales bacterium]
MEKVSLIVFQKDCMGCHACEVACKQEHELDVGPRFIKVIERAPSYIPIYCHHCARPPCKDACPEDAIFRDETGIVHIKEDLCIGCKACIEACPFGAMQFDEEREVAVKCDLCYERLKMNEEPACSTACPTQCILWGNMNKVSEEIEERLLQQ